MCGQQGRVSRLKISRRCLFLVTWISYFMSLGPHFLSCPTEIIVEPMRLGWLRGLNKPMGTARVTGGAQCQEEETAPV
jgi:hypothetical protein